MNWPSYTLFHYVILCSRLHDRKVAALGLCYLLGMTQDVRPQEVHDISSQIVPSLLVLFQGLKRAYECRYLKNQQLLQGKNILRIYGSSIY